jgi:hypothetical protein
LSPPLSTWEQHEVTCSHWDIILPSADYTWNYIWITCFYTDILLHNVLLHGNYIITTRLHWGTTLSLLNLSHLFLDWDCIIHHLLGKLNSGLFQYGDSRYMLITCYYWDTAVLSRYLNWQRILSTTCFSLSTWCMFLSPSTQALTIFAVFLTHYTHSSFGTLKVTSSQANKTHQ